MFRNHKRLVGFWEVRNLFEELSSLDNHVDCSFRQIDSFHFNIKHPKSFDKAFHHLDKTVGDRHARFSLHKWDLMNSVLAGGSTLLKAVE
jgi:hypothetical protein